MATSLVKQFEVDCGQSGFTDYGNWISGFKETVDGIEFPGYPIGGRVHTAKGVYVSLIDDNTTNPDTDTTGSWRTDINLVPVTEATDHANNQASLANDAAVLAQQKASLAQVAANSASAVAEEAAGKVSDMNTGLSRLEELEATLTAKDRQQPTAMKLTYPKKITFGNTAEQRIEATLSPAGTGKNVLFLSDNRSVQVMPDGFIRVLSVGKSFVHAIPTENTAIYQTVEIEVLPTPIRMLTSTAMRLTSSGAMRLG